MSNALAITIRTKIAPNPVTSPESDCWLAAAEVNVSQLLDSFRSQLTPCHHLGRRRLDSPGPGLKCVSEVPEYKRIAEIRGDGGDHVALSPSLAMTRNISATWPIVRSSTMMGGKP